VLSGEKTISVAMYIFDPCIAIVVMLKTGRVFVSVLRGHLTNCNNLVGFTVCVKLDTIYIYFNFFSCDTW